MAKYQKYAEYKDSGVEWLGEIPRHWDSKPLKYLCTYNDEVLPETTAKDAEIQYIDIGSVSAVDGISKIETMIFKDAPSRARRIVRDGDVIVSTVRTYLEAIAPINNPPENLIVSTGFAVIRPNQYLYKSFASYCLRAKGFIKEVVARSVGVSYPAINSSDLVNITIPSIGYVEQVKIANFLDHETAKIDSLIAKQEKLIELVKEKRQAVISHAVTKGLNPDVAMKDSGVEWLGQVPEHWVVSFIKYILAKAKDAMVDGPFGSSVNTATDYVEDGIPVIRTVNITNQGFSSENLKFMRISKFEELKRHSVKTGDVLFSKVGTIGNACIFPENMGVGILSTTGSCKISINEDLIDRDFLVFQIHCMNQELTQIANANVQPFLNMTNIKNLRISLPSLDEQKSIISLLKSKLDSFDRLIAKAESAIQLMQERRTALISAAVTGKIDVRNWQHPNEAKKGLSS
ncbi:restriction endonuclease subunit S [Acinetobacter towneri]|uniref:restriction endonuclease subunit S n=1 Tax=Acinetobacter towneri TaxID=202956 RepID=UPI003213AC44